MSDKFEIKITGDATGGSAALKKIATDAKTMGTDVATASEKSAESLKKVQERATAVGAAMGTVIGVVARSGQAYASQEQQIRALDRSYGDASQQVQQFARDLQDQTTFSDDAARQSAQLASTLIRNYGLTADQVQRLISVTADLAVSNTNAEGKQFDLLDAVQRTSSAIRGEAESAEALGLTMNDNVVAAAAAARGITGWTTTMTDAEKAQFRFTLLLEQANYAQGAAAELADTRAGQARQFINSLQDEWQALGKATGAMGEYLSVLSEIALALPLVTGGIGRLAAGLGAIGIGGTAIGGAAALGGSAYYAYNLNTSRGGWAETVTASILAKAAGVANALTPGNAFSGIQEQYQGVIDGGQLYDLAKSIYYSPPGDLSNDKWAVNKLKLSGVLPPDFTGTIAEAAEYINNIAGPSGLSAGQYITGQLGSADYYVFDPISQQWMAPHVLSNVRTQRAQIQTENINRYATSYVGSPGTNFGSLMQGPIDPYGGQGIYNPFQLTLSRTSPQTGVDYITNPDYAAYGPGGTGAIANSLSGQGAAPITLSPANQAAADAANAEAVTQALRDQYGAYFHLVDGIQSANQATNIFKATQDGILASENVYTQQISEFSSQVNAQDAAYQILNQRREEGVALTGKEIEFLDNYARANERGTGAVEDATISAGMLAQQYLLNMEKGDQLNQTLAESAGSVDELVTVIEDLILAMSGVPEEVRTRIELDRANEAMAAIATYSQMLDSLPSSKTTTLYVDTVESFRGSSASPLGGRDGGVMGYANGGVITRMAEAGPEFLRFRNGGSAWAMTDGLYNVPRGTFVTPAPASKGMKSGVQLNINGPITVVANDPMQFANALREQAIGESRL